MVAQFCLALAAWEIYLPREVQGIAMPVTAHPSLKWDLILDGAARRYPDGREKCCDTPKGKREYQKRIFEMGLRQHNVCGLGPHLLRDPTFEHTDLRGAGGSRRDDRIWDAEGNPMNLAACGYCNNRKGSRRT